MTRIYIDKPKLVVISIVVLLMFHLLLHVNETYEVRYREYVQNFADGEGSINGPSESYEYHLLSGISRSQYESLLESLGEGQRANAIENTEKRYFGLLPAWIINLVYVGYFILGILVVTRLKTTSL